MGEIQQEKKIRGYGNTVGKKSTTEAGGEQTRGENSKKKKQNTHEIYV